MCQEGSFRKSLTVYARKLLIGQTRRSDELNRDAYILIAIDKWSKFPAAKVVANTTADVAIKFMQRYISNNGVPRRLRCDQAKTLRAKEFHFFATIIT